MIVDDDGQSPVRLLDASLDDSLLVKTQCIYPGSRIVIEVLSTGVLALTSDESAAIQALLKQKSSVVLYFNNPFDTVVARHGGDGGTTAEGCDPSEADADNDNNTINPSSIFDNPSYDLSIAALLDQPLHEVMSLIARSVLRVGDDSRVFHCKRSASSPQLKDTDKTLRELAFVNHSIIHLQVMMHCCFTTSLLCRTIAMPLSIYCILTMPRNVTSPPPRKVRAVDQANTCCASSYSWTHWW